MQPKFFQVLGEILVLMSQSKVHSHFSSKDILRSILRPIALNQFRIYRAGTRPVAYVAWAKLSEDIERKYLTHKYTLKPADWNSGTHIVFTDFIAPFGHARKVARDLKKHFSGAQGKSMRFDSVGKLRKTQSWKGAKHKKGDSTHAHA